MHEFSLAEELLKLAREEARKAGIKKLEKVVVRIGALSGISAEALEFAFSFLREEDELSRQAELVVEHVPGRGRCRTCGKEVDLERIFLYCPECETPTVEITQGSDFHLVRLEGQDEPDAAEASEARPASEGEN
jgi:hydrogenase nickel incorporation protein HypA/HybF